MSQLRVVFGRPARGRSGGTLTRTSIVRGGVLLAMIATVGFFTGSTARAADGGYGPGIAGPAGAPGGFSNIVTTHAFGTVGGTVGAAVPGGQALLTVPDGAFDQPVQAVLTAPDLSGINAVLPQLGFGSYTAIAGVGISIDDANGKPITELFSHPLTLSITGNGIGAGDLLVEFTSLSTAATLSAAVFTTGNVTVSLAADPDFAILAPSTAASSSPTPASSAPTSVLGEQFTKANNGSSIVVTSLFTTFVILVIVAAFIVLVPRRRRSPDSFIPRHSSTGGRAKQQRAPMPTFTPKHARS